MNDKKLLSYYNKLHNPKYTLGDWVITNDKLYNKIKGKLKITNIMGCYFEANLNELSNARNVICETKNKYISFKFNSCFFSIRESDTEYGLIGEYELLAVNKTNVKKQEAILNISIYKLFDLFEITLSKKAKETLKYLEYK